VNAFTGETNKGQDVLDGEYAKCPRRLAKHYKAAGVRARLWSATRTTARAQPRARRHGAPHLGVPRRLVKSFARIHETNLKKQGILALTFADPADYEKVREDDRVTIEGVASIAPRLTHRAPDPRPEPRRQFEVRSSACRVKHTFSAEQLEWFKAGRCGSRGGSPRPG
jgi:aconitate hydratase